MLNNYRTSTNIREISKIISNPKNLKNGILWQNHGMKRFIFDIEDIKVNERFMSFETRINRQTALSFNPMEQTYCKLPYRETVFKVSVINFIDRTVTFNIPADVKTLELRENPRQKFKPSDGKHITVQVSSELLSGATQALKFQVIDISATGVSIVVSDKNIKYFENSFNFDVTSIMDQELIPKASMQMVYSQMFKFKQRGKIVQAYRVGFKFLTPLSVSQIAPII